MVNEIIKVLIIEDNEESGGSSFSGTPDKMA
jgi:hypothetical protein